MLRHCCTILSMLLALSSTAQVPGKITVPLPTAKPTVKFTFASIAQGILFNILLKKISKPSTTLSSTASTVVQYDTTTLLKKINSKFTDPFYTPFEADLTLNTLAVQLNNNQQYLTWQTNNEFNVGGFMIEKSVDNINFTAIASVEGTNSFVLKDYAFIDTKIDTVRHWYRLRVIGFNANVQYTPSVRANEATGSSAIQVEHKASARKLYISSPFAIKKLEIINTDGKVVINKKKVDILKPISTQALANGTYAAKILTNNGVLSQLFFKIET